jgi:hypothetical protein
MTMTYPIKHGPLAPHPGVMSTHPWRFTLGQHVYLAGRPPTFTYQVTGGELHLGFPHLHLSDALGHTYRVPQLCVSSKPISSR